jgi:hypothetical protein
MYVIYHKDSTRYLSRLTRAVDADMFATAAAAKAALTRACKKDEKIVREDFLVEESSVFHRSIERQQTVRSAFDGRPVMEPVNTPYACSVRSDAFWQN